MFTSLLMALVIAPLPTTSPTATDSLPPERVAVIVQADNVGADSDATHLAPGGLSRAVVNYCDFLLSCRGVSFEIMPVPAETEQRGYAEHLLTSGFDVVVGLRSHGRYESRKVTWTDRRRRHHRRTVNGYAVVEVAYQYFVSGDDGAIESRRYGCVRERAAPDWQDLPLSLRNRTADSIVTFNPEPLGYVVQRALTGALRWLEEGRVTVFDNPDGLPIFVYADSSFIRAAADDWRQSVTDMVGVASRSMQLQFGRPLRLVRLLPHASVNDSGMTFQQIYRRLSRSTPVHGDTVLVYVTSHAVQDGLAPQHRREAIGRTDPGRGLILLDGRPFPHPRQAAWRSFENGLNLLHELGHTLGAIHVADFGSVMNPSANWVASDRFDPLNRAIIREALQGRIDFNDPADYLNAVSQQLRESNYALAEYPAFLYEYFSRGANRSRHAQLREAVAHDSYLIAADAYRWLKKGHVSKAAALLRQAIEQDPLQADLYYLLSQVTDGEESATAVEKAAAMGHAKARSRLSARLVDQ